MLEKVSKNLFRMLRDERITYTQFAKKFEELREKQKSVEKIHLDLGYYKELESYIENLYIRLIMNDEADEKLFDDVREAEMSNLNRLQKLKNSSSYKKSKHKNRDKSEYLE